MIHLFVTKCSSIYISLRGTVQSRDDPEPDEVMCGLQVQEGGRTLANQHPPGRAKGATC